MKAAILEATGSIDHLHLRDVPEPRPGPGEVLVRLRAASLNYRDLVVVRGGYGPGQKHDLIPLSDGAGEVVEVGPGVTDLRVGDRVVTCFFQDWPAGRATPARLASALGGPRDGVACELRALPAGGVTKFPDHLSFGEAAALPCAALTAWNALFGEGTTLPGDVVVTQGTGGVSMFAAQLAVAAGARLVATSSSDAKLERLRDLGASDVIHYGDVPEWGKRVRALTDGRGADLVVEIGGAGTLAQSMRAVRPGGTIALIGVVTGGKAELPLGAIVTSGMRLAGVTVGHRELQGDMLSFMGQRRLRPVLDRTFPLAEIRAALAHLEAARHVGKVLIEIRSSLPTMRGGRRSATVDPVERQDQQGSGEPGWPKRTSSPQRGPREAARADASRDGTPPIWPGWCSTRSSIGPGWTPPRSTT